MSMLRLTLCACLVSTALAVGEPAMAPKDVLRQMTGCLHRGRALRRKIADATAAEHLRQEAAQASVDAFNRPYDPERVVKLKRRLESMRESIAYRVAELTALRVKSLEVRDDRRAEAEAEAEWAREEYGTACQKAEAGVGEARTAYLKESRPVAAALEALVAGVARVPDGLGIAEAHTAVCMGPVLIDLTWNDGQGKALAHARCEFPRWASERVIDRGRVAGPSAKSPWWSENPREPTARELEKRAQRALL